MTIALSTLIQEFEEFIEALPVISAADAGSNATKIVDAVLSIYGDGYFNDYFVYVLTGLALGDIRQVEDFDKATTTIDPYVDFSDAVAAGDDYEIHKNNPDAIKRALNDALVSIYPKLYRKIIFETLGQDDLVNNAAAAQAVVEVTDDTLFFVGQVVTVTDDNDSEELTILSIAAATNKLTMTANLTNAYTTAANAKVVCQSGKFFNLGAAIGNARVTGLFLKSDDESTRKRTPAFEIIQSLAGERQIYFHDHTVSVDDQTLVIEATAKLEAVSAPADPVTLEDRRVKLLYAEAAYHFYERQANEVSSGDWDRLKALATGYRRKVFDDYRHLWMPRITEIADISTDGD